ncbi:nuclear transport factor 2 family protein [candidate division KSB1 bacterium]|nr:nuclear transport factor 2 family protein [candidate division KSB1 bacterium]
MRRILMISVLAIFASSLAVAQEQKTDQNTKVENELIQLDNELGKAFMQKDIATLRHLIADDYVGIESNGIVFDKAETIADVDSGYFIEETEEADDLKVRVYGNTAVVTGRLTYQWRGKDGGDNSKQLLFADVWVKRDGRWQVVNYQGTKIAQ